MSPRGKDTRNGSGYAINTFPNVGDWAQTRNDGAITVPTVHSFGYDYLPAGQMPISGSQNSLSTGPDKDVEVAVSVPAPAPAVVSATGRGTRNSRGLLGGLRDKFTSGGSAKTQEEDGQIVSIQVCFL